RDQHRRCEPKVAGGLEREESHGERATDHRHGERAHADNGIDIDVGLKCRPDKVEPVRKKLSAKRAKEERGEKQTATEAGTEGDNGSKGLQHEDRQEGRERQLEQSGEM